MKEQQVTGQTKDTGFQIGVRKTYPVSAEAAWDFLFSDEGLASWLGNVKATDIDTDKAYKTKDGTEGKVLVFKPLSHIRMSWKKKEWKNTPTLQVRLIRVNDKATISFHQEKLTDSTQRKEMNSIGMV
jgi:uncharacterized protein YndB with AHSA1/START domain